MLYYEPFSKKAFLWDKLNYDDDDEDCEFVSIDLNAMNGPMRLLCIEI